MKQFFSVRLLIVAVIVIYSVILLLFGCGISGDFYARKSAMSNIISEKPQVSVFLIGDCGAPSATEPEPAFIGLQTALKNSTAKKKIVIFLGDNIYTRGLGTETDPERAEQERRLQAQIQTAAAFADTVYFVPGNHDWDNSKSDGRAAIIRQQEFITQHYTNVQLQPRNACPGPSFVDIQDVVRIIFLDTQWWLHKHDKPIGGECMPFATEDSVLYSLQNAITSVHHKNTIIVGHHPLRSNGSHGGFFDWKAHLFPFRVFHKNAWFPLPIIGSLYPFLRVTGYTDQDFSGERNEHFRRRIDSVLQATSPLLFAAGHEHALQLFEEEYLSYAVSGNGILKHSEEITTSDNMIFGSTRPGFMEINIYSNEEPVLTAHIADQHYTSTKPVYTTKLRYHRAKVQQTR